MARHGLLVAVENRPVMLFKVTQALAEIDCDVDYVDIVRRPPHIEIFLESELADVDAAVARIGTVDGVLSVTAAPPMSAI
jgi:predicted CoA-binding protein